MLDLMESGGYDQTIAGTGFSALLALLPVVVALLLTVFYIGMFYSWNVPEEFSPDEKRAGPERPLPAGVDVCRVSPTKLQIDAWVLAEDRDGAGRLPLLLLQDKNTGRYYRLKTRTRTRGAVEQAVEAGSVSAYSISGSIHYGVGIPDLVRGRVYVGHFVRDGYLLRELPCRI